jgi:hypothetical protein
MAKRRRRARKTTRRRTTRHTSPLGNLAKKVQGIDTRLHGLEAKAKRFVKRKRKKSHSLGTLEESGTSHWTTGE